MRLLFIGLFLLLLTTDAWSKEKKWTDNPCYKKCMIEIGWCFKKSGDSEFVDSCLGNYYAEEIKNDKISCMNICLGRPND